MRVLDGSKSSIISIHALLAESDLRVVDGSKSSIFLSTLSLRRATINTYHRIFGEGISIHALLAESDTILDYFSAVMRQFLSTLSLRRATGKVKVVEPGFVFLSTLSLRRATCYSLRHSAQSWHFYPRSPCGERQDTPSISTPNPDFYPRSPCGERLNCSRNGFAMRYFYPRSPCGERPNHTNLPGRN